MYTDEEIEASVLRYLTTEAATQKTEAGMRDIGASKQQVFELVSAAFLLKPGALYYLTWLASNSLRALVAEQLIDFATIVEAAPFVYKNSKRVESVTELYNAESALLSLTSAFQGRSSGVRGSIGPAVQRFRTSVDRFMRSELTKNVVVQGDIQETPEELRVRILDTWNSSAKDRHEEITARLSLFTSIFSTYAKVKLPSSVVSSMLARVQAVLSTIQTSMASTSAAQDSRAAMLELSTMKSLLLAASRFVSPTLVRAPLVGDSATATVGLPGYAPEAVGIVSGPFNYKSGATLSYVVNGTPGSVVLPSSSAAQIKGKVMSPWAAPPGGSICSVYVNRGPAVSVASAAWASGPAAATALSALAGVTVTWDAGTSQLVFETTSAADGARLEFDASSSAKLDFVNWLLGSGLRFAIGMPVATDTVVAALAVGALAPSKERQTYGSFNAVRGGAGDEDILWTKLASGSDLVSDGTTTLVAGVNLESLGVTPGMAIVLTAPTPATRAIVSVAGRSVVVDAVVPAATNTYYAGPDHSAIPAGTRALVNGATPLADNGHYRVLSSGPAYIQLDQSLDNQGSVSVSLFSEFIALSLSEFTEASSLVCSASTGATALGLSGTHASAVSGLETSFASPRGVEVGDTLVLTNPSSVETSHTITSTDPLQFTPTVAYVAGDWSYEIRDAKYEVLQSVITDVLSVVGEATFALKSIQTAVLALARGGRYSGVTKDALDGYVSNLTEILAVFDAYEVEQEDTIKQATKLLQEYGFDRALDLFVSLDLQTFFDLPDDGVSYRTWTTRKAADAARLVTPVTRDPREPGEDWRTSAIQNTAYNPSGEFKE